MAKPPAFDARGKDQLNRALAPDEYEDYDPETGRSTLRRLEVHPARKAKGESVTMRRRRKLTQRALSMYTGGERVIDIAEALGVAPTTITTWLSRHRREVKLGEIDEDIDAIAVPIAKDNFIHGLLAGDKDYTLEALKGRGHLRRHTQEQSNIKLEMPPLRVEYTLPEGVLQLPADAAIVAGRIVGAIQLPKEVKGVVIEQRQLTAGADVGVGGVRVPGESDNG